MRRQIAAMVLIGSIAWLSSAAAQARILINEVMYNPLDPELEFIELVNDGEEPVDLSGWGFVDGVIYIFSEGTVLEPGALLVVCRDRVALAAATGLPAAALEGEYSGALASGGERIALARPNGDIADEFEYDDDPPFDTRADGGGPSLERLCHASSAALPGNWRASLSDGGSPLAANQGPICPPPPPGAFSPIVITEVHYHPVNDRDETEEFIELHNQSDDEVDLEGWSLARGIEYVFEAANGPTRIAPGGYLLVARDPAGLSAATGFPESSIAGPWSGALSNYRDEIDLLAPDGRPLDRIEYRQDGLWPAHADGLGSSLQRVRSDAAGMLPQNWRVARGVDCEREMEEVCTLFEHGVDVRWFQNLSGEDPGFGDARDWFHPDFDDIAEDWFDGELGVGYDTDPEDLPPWVRTNASAIPGLHSILVRIEFDWDPDSVACASRTLHLAADQDDGIVVWLNGVEVARDGMTAGPGVVPPFDGSFGAEVITARGVNTAEPGYRTAWIGDADALLPGRNVLAIGNYNSRNTSSDLYASVRMTLGAGPATGDVTPGRASSVAQDSVPPLVVSAEHEPALPISSDAVLVRAVVDGHAVDSVDLVWDAGPGEVVSAMRDDGLGGDTMAGDGVWVGTVPPQANDTLVRYRVDAANADGCSTSLPREGNPSAFTGYYVQDDRPDSNEDVRLFYIFTPGALVDLTCTEGVRRPGTFVDHRGRAYFDVGVKFRGETACNYPKKPIRVRFQKGDYFDAQESLNLNAGWNDKAMYRERFGFDFFRDAGVAYSETHLARVHTNGNRFHGAYFTVEDPSNEYLRRNDWDDDGALYKCRSAFLNGSTSAFEGRSSSASEHRQAVGAFGADMNRLGGQSLIDLLEADLNVEAFIDYQAPQVIIIDGDSVVKNWLLYYGPHSRGKTGENKIACFAWDIDLSHGQMYLTQDQRFHNIHPLFQTRTYPFVGQGHHGIVNAVLERAPDDYFVKAYYGRMWTLLQEKYHPDVILPKMAAFDANTIETVQLDLNRWRRTWGARGNDPSFWRDNLEAWLERRHAWLVDYLTSDNPTTGGRRFQYVPAPRLRFTELQYNPSRNEQLSFLEIRNLETRDVDISGWTIPAIDWVFPAGSVAPAEGFIVVAKQPALFVAEHPNLPESLPVFGPFLGDLSNGGEEVRLRDNGRWLGRDFYPETIDVLTYDDEAPWPTEADGEGPSLELRDLSLDNDLASSWQVSPLLGGSPGSLTIDNLPPVAVLDHSVLRGPPPLRVDFDASRSSDPDGDEITFSWDFGDGIVGVGPVVSRTYRNTGSFVVTLTVEDSTTRTTTARVVVEVVDEEPATLFRRGDVNSDGERDISDGVALLLGLFQGTDIGCLKSADVDDDGQVIISDAIVLLNHLFQQGVPPAAPNTSCGTDPTADSLSCESHPACNDA